MGIYKENLEFLKYNAADIYKTLTKTSTEFEYRETYIPEEDNFLVESGDIHCFLHSRYSKENEAKMMFSGMPADTEVLVLFGVGCGYAIEYLLKRESKIRYLIIIEPMVPVFKLFLSRYRLSDMGSIGKFTCILNMNGDSVYSAMRNVLICELESKLYFAFNISYRTIFSKYYNDIQFNVLRLLRTEKTILCSNYINYKLKAYNFMSNLKVESLPVELLKKLFQGRPAIIVSAGPSLNKNIESLRLVNNKAVIIAVGSAIKILDNRGIRPHFRLAFDWTQNEKTAIFDNLEDKDIPLIFADQLFCKILPEYSGKKFRMLIKDSKMTEYALKDSNIGCDIYSNGISVANIALSLLCKMNCSHIIFMGQDMCYENNKLYAEGGTQTEMIQSDKELIQTRNIYGRKVFSIIQYLQIKYGLEETIKAYPAVNFINATEGGLGIDGAVNMDMSEVLNEILIKDSDFNIEEYVNNIYRPNEIKSYMEKIKRGINVISEQNENLFQQCMEIVDKFRSIGLESDAAVIEERNNNIEKAVENVHGNEFYKNVVSAALSSVLAVLNYKEATKQSVTIGNKISEAVRGEISSVTEYCMILKSIIKNLYGN